MIKIRSHKYYEVDWAGDKKITKEKNIIYVIINLIIARFQFEFQINRGPKRGSRRYGIDRRL
jgi:hypothetical protein